MQLRDLASLSAATLGQRSCQASSAYYLTCWGLRSVNPACPVNQHSRMRRPLNGTAVPHSIGICYY